MSRITLGVICGLVFGVVDAGMLIPMSFPDKKAAMAAGFVSRFAIGFVIGTAHLPGPSWGVGLFFGLLLSVTEALITGAYAPILATGAVGGMTIGFVVGHFGI